ncbi:phosphotransferase [Acerihabitans sp. KWT182]|uniref:Hydroxylysine kinase n=1 Tax=Acerihabitans sp. KWT182 TaxID=3157919 RepID=A0AAU7Q517_9GAMM
MSEPRVDVNLLASDAPAADCGDARRAAWELYGIEAAATAIAGERDANFLLTAENRPPRGTAFFNRADERPRWMLKFINPAEDSAESDFQDALLRHVARRDPGLPVPRLISGSTAGEGPHYTLGERRLRVRLVTWLAGTSLDKVTMSPKLLGTLGSGLARLDLALASFRHPASGRTLLWNGSQPGRARPYLPLLDDMEQRPVLEALLDRLEEQLPLRLKAVPHQVIHNDFNPHNVLIDAEADALGGIIDFGDALYGPRVNELATALAYQVSDEGDVMARMPAFVAGYQRVLPLTDEEIRLLPMLIAARLALSVILTQWRAQRYPANRAYILRHRVRAWSGLQRWRAIGDDSIADRLASAAMERTGYVQR